MTFNYLIFIKNIELWKFENVNLKIKYTEKINNLLVNFTLLHVH